MNLLKWNDKTMRLGISLIDEQHKELLNIINELNIAIYNNTQKKNILCIVDRLIDYAKFHFTTEEELFKNLKYKEKEEHINEHKEFLNRFSKLKNELIDNEHLLNQSAIEISQEVLMYLIDWFLHHIAGSDKKYAKIFISLKN